jgi:hypothetical protein
VTDDADIDIVETAPAGDAERDVISGRAPRPPVRWPMRPSWLAGLVAIALLAGIGIGYLIGRPHHHAAAPAPTPTTVTLSREAGLSLGETCYGIDASSGRVLMVGVNLVNDGARPVVLTGVQGVFPLGGLRQVGSQDGECDNNATAVVNGRRIDPSATAWVSLILAVQVRCPGPLPVQFRIDYAVDGAPSTQLVSPFPDLGQVPYPGCPTH